MYTYQVSKNAISFKTLHYFILCKKKTKQKKPQKNNRNQLIAGHSINELVDNVPIRIHFVN